MSDPQSREDPGIDLTGRRLGDYRILRLLGSGGMADVYLAEQQSLRRRIALKVLRHAFAAADRYVRRIHQESRAAAALVHANIVQIYEIGHADGNHFIAQEYVPGENLKQLLDRLGSLPIATTLTIVDQVAAALQRADSGKIVHRDIKPENILLSTWGEVKVADFGLARILDGRQSLEITRAGTTWGTPLYMSPEQIEARPLDARSDLYSLGVTTFQMLVGKPPFEGDTALAVAVQHLQQGQPPLADLRPDAPPEFQQIVDQLLAKQPADRFQSAAELRGVLRQVDVVERVDWPVITSPIAALTERVPLAATEQLQRVMYRATSSRMWARRAALLAVLALIAFLAGSVWAWRRRPPDPRAVMAANLPEIPRNG
jgi:serine/threonine-protein kinase